jgi:hypothetical protein
VTRVVALVPDLIDASRIEVGITRAGASVEFVSGAAELVGASVGAALVIVDLQAPDAIDALRSVSTARTLAYGSHVDRVRLEQARAAGCDHVLARSALFRTLPSLVASIVTTDS